MRIDVLWTPAELEGFALQGRPAVVIDVLRAATSIVTAISNGARAVVPTESTEEALRIRESIGRDQVLLCGERQGVRIDGFDRGNSPGEFDAEAVRDRVVVMTTTNGTRTLLATAGARRSLVCALVNLGAVAGALAESGGDPVIVCSGREGRVSADDAYCAGLLARAWLDRVGGDPEPNDGALAAIGFARGVPAPIVSFLRRTQAGRALERVGHGDDIAVCARIDSIAEVPVFRDRQVTRPAARDATADR